MSEGSGTARTPDLVTAVLAAAERDPRATAVIDAKGRGMRYGLLRRRVLTVCHSLRAAGMAAGDGVLFSVRPSVDALILALGISAAGGVVVFADPGTGPELFDARMRLAQPRWAAAESLVYSAGSGYGRLLARQRGLSLPDLAALPVRHIHTGRRLPGVPPGALSLDALLGPSPGQPAGDPATGRPGGPAEQVELPPGAPSVVVFTSGTTQRPRAVVHTRGSLMAGFELLGRRCALGPGDIVHTDQLMLGLPALATGACWSLPGHGTGPARFVRQLATRRATHTFCVPVDLARLLDRTPRLPATLRCLILGSAPVPPELLERAVAAVAGGTEVLSLYGLTEMLPVAVADADAKLAHARAGIPGDLLGTLLPGIDARLAHDGELLLRGPNLCHGYLGEPPLEELRTGDAARFDQEGQVVMLGRTKDMIIRDGANIYPGLYEPLIGRLPGVAEAVLIGVADTATGDEQVVLAVVRNTNTDPAGLRSRLARTLPGLIDACALPDRIEVLADLPRAGRSRKLDRDEVRARVNVSRATS